jgi:hypothetical protein
MRRLAQALAALLLLPAAVSADPSDDRQWRDEMTSMGGSAYWLNSACTSPQQIDQKLCDHVFAAVLTVHRAMTLNRPELAAYCRDREPTVDDARTIFLRWYRRHNETFIPLVTFEAPAGVAVLAALRDESPCWR